MIGEGKTVSLVLSSGGARGTAQIGAIEVLEEEGFTIQAVSGSSIGSAIGGSYVAGHLQNYSDWLTSLDQYDVFRLMDFTISKQGMMKGERVFSALEKRIGNPLIEDLPLEFTAVATDLRNKKEVWFREGNLLEAIRASVSIPGIITPYYHNGRELVDGGLLNPVPIEPAREADTDLLIVINLNADIPYHPPAYYQDQNKEEEKRINALFNRFAERWQLFTNHKHELKEQSFSYLNLLTNTFNVMNMRMTELLLEKTQPDLIIPISGDACTTMAFYRSAEMIEAGRKATRQALAEYARNAYS